MRNVVKRVLLFLLVTTFSIPVRSQQPVLNKSIQSLSEEFFAWRAATQPVSMDDIVRVERPDGWTPDVSPEALAREQQRYVEFRKRLDELPREAWSRTDSVDFLLLRSATERVDWELNYLRAPFRNPDFYSYQTVGAVYELLLLSSPMTDNRVHNIILRLESIPATLRHAQVNLKEPVAPFAKLALNNLEDIRGKLERTSAALKRASDKKFHEPLDRATRIAAQALEEYGAWIRSKTPGMKPGFSIGRPAYEHFLKTIALIPMTPDEMLTAGRAEFARAVFVETMEKNRRASLPEQRFFSSAAEQVEQSGKDELAIRAFLEENNIMSVPSWIHHYRNKELPPYAAPLSSFAVTDDLTSATRLDEDGISYVTQPSPDLSFFGRASALDPRPIIVHEGVPGHYFQLARSWKNPDPIRRHYFDSGANEGIGFYVEEMMVQAGLFDNDRPWTREIMARFLRLRALRVEVDIQLALGNFSIEQGAEYLSKTVPMERRTAVDEASFFAYNPGQAISYQIGKIQIEKFMADARSALGSSFRLRDFHDYLVDNGNVPIALLRWEYLGLNNEIEKLW